ncbi:MAG: Uncharacterised protein [Flavobacteriia bacterium]|nr:MAG: Uncharacterised protein [Flavobacteriia bacterium]
MRIHSWEVIKGLKRFATVFTSAHDAVLHLFEEHLGHQLRCRDISSISIEVGEYICRNFIIDPRSAHPVVAVVQLRKDSNGSVVLRASEELTIR